MCKVKKEIWWNFHKDLWLQQIILFAQTSFLNGGDKIWCWHLITRRVFVANALSADGFSIHALELNKKSLIDIVFQQGNGYVYSIYVQIIISITILMKLKNITKTYNLECTNETGYVKILIVKMNKECVLTIPFEDS